MQLLCLSHDGTRVAIVAESASGAEIVIYSASDGAVVSRLPQQRCLSAIFSADGKRLFTATGHHANGPLVVWDVESGRKLAEERPDGSHVIAVDLSPDGATLAYGYCDGTVLLWDVQRNEPALTLPPDPSGYLVHLAFSGDGEGLYSVGETLVLRDSVPQRVRYQRRPRD